MDDYLISSEPSVGSDDTPIDEAGDLLRLAFL